MLWKYLLVHCAICAVYALWHKIQEVMGGHLSCTDWGTFYHTQKENVLTLHVYFIMLSLGMNRLGEKYHAQTRDEYTEGANIMQKLGIIRVEGENVM